MNKPVRAEDFGTIKDLETLTIQRVLPGPIDRVWSYLIDSDLRRKWLAAGEMELHADAPFEFVWRNDELTTPPGKRPEGFAAEQHMQSRIIKVDPPRKLVIAWGADGDVSFELSPKGDRVLLTLIHRRLGDRSNASMFGAGWHMHLDILAARMSGGDTEPFWDGWSRLRQEYDRRIPA
jgi:uncharacterized protein YndB with AHSA1/START domain